jgi:hypothetical protein
MHPDYVTYGLVKLVAAKKWSEFDFCRNAIKDCTLGKPRARTGLRPVKEGSDNQIVVLFWLLIRVPCCYSFRNTMQKRGLYAENVIKTAK